jgi:hypothetical protein
VLGTFARLTVAGRSEYRPWMHELAHRLVDEADSLGLPGFLARLLID